MAYEDISFRDKSNWKSKSYLILTHMPVEVWKLCDIYMWGHIVLWIDLLHNSQTVTKVIENLNVASSSFIYIPFEVWSSTGSVNFRYTWESNGHAKDKSRHFVTKVYSKLQAFKFRLFRSFNLNIEILDIKYWRPKQYILTSWGKLQGSLAVWESVWCLFIAAGPNVHQSPHRLNPAFS